MSKFNVLLLPFAILIWAGSIVLFLSYSQTEYQQVQEKKLEYASNYSVDAAVDVLIESTADLGLDYGDYESVAVSPEISLKTFLQIFCKNYGMSLSEENYSRIKNDYLSAFIVAMYDGYYIGKPQVINSSGAIDILFSLKQPYLYKSEDGKLYALNLGKVDARCYDGLTISRVSAPISEIEQKIVINSNVSDALASTVFEVKEGNMQSTIYVPIDLTNLTTTNPIDKVTVMSYVSNPDVGSGELTETLGIGGARIRHTSYCACYIKEGVRLYCYAEDVPEGVVVISTYETPVLAAQNGYYFDITTL